MDNYESRPLLPMPFPKRLKEMTDEELTKLLTGNFNYNVLIPGLKRNSVPYQGQELTDEFLMELRHCD